MAYKRLLILIPAFVCAVALGTLLHEGGHLLVARHLGYFTELHYQSVSYHQAVPPYHGADASSEAALGVSQGGVAIIEKPVTPIHSFLITLGGPLQTVLTGSMAFLILYRSREGRNSLSISDWVLVFLSLFWLREPANFIAWMIKASITGDTSGGGDEFKLAAAVGLPDYALLLILAVIGVLIAVITVFRLVPASHRKSFLTAGLLGSGLGYWLWFYVLGPRLLP